MTTPWVSLPLHEQICGVVYEFSEKKRPFIPLIPSDIMICLQSYNNEWYRGYSLRSGPKETGIFPVNRVRPLELPSSTDKAKLLYHTIWLRILWTRLLEMYTSESPTTCKTLITQFDKARRGIMNGNEENLIELGDRMECGVPPFTDGLVNDWRNVSFGELRQFLGSNTRLLTTSKPVTKTLHLDINAIFLGLEFKDNTRGYILLYLFDESRSQQVSETIKIPFLVDKLGKLPDFASLAFIDVKHGSVKPSMSIIFRIHVQTPINEQKKTTTPVYKQAFWGCVNITDTVRCMDSQLTVTSNVTLIPYHVGDKTEFTTKRHSKLQVNKQQFVSYRMRWDKLESQQKIPLISVANVGEILRSPALPESRLYLTLVSGWFEQGKKKSEKNVEVRVSVVDDKDEVVSQGIIEGSNKKPFYRSSVARHCNLPRWNEMVTISIPDEAFSNCFVKFECSHITSSELTQKSTLKWITYFPLSTQAGNVIPNGTYALKLLPKNSYISRDLWEEDVHIEDRSKLTQKITVLTQLDSSTLTDTPAIYKIKSWKKYSKDVKAILKDLNLTDFSKCVEHCRHIFSAILEIIDSCAEGETIAYAMEVLFSFNRFWNTNEEFKSRLLDTLKNVTFVSGLLKVVSWIKFVFKEETSTRFRQTIKSLSMLITIMSKSFVHIRETKLMPDVEVDRYKVVLANLLVDISDLKVEGNVILSSQIIRVFPESLKILYNDQNISINEFSFHMISLMKGAVLSMWKESSSTRLTYIDHLQFIVKSRFMEDESLQQRYFKDMVRAMQLDDSFTKPEVDAMANIVVEFCESCKPNMHTLGMFSEILILLQSYSSKIASSGYSIKNANSRLTFLSLQSTLVDYLTNPPKELTTVASEHFESTIQIVKAVIAKIGSEDNDEAAIIPQINHAIFCKRLYLVYKIATSSSAMCSNFMNDVTFISASILGEQLPKIDHHNAPNVSIYCRAQLIHDELSDKVKRNLFNLCKIGTFDQQLMNPVIAMGLERNNLNWLFQVIDTFLSIFPERLNEIFLNIHRHKNKLRNECFNVTVDFKSSRTRLVMKQLELIVTVANATMNDHIFLIANVENIVSLMKFYSKYQCWDPFRETVDVYKQLLINSESFLEAAELIVYYSKTLPDEVSVGRESDMFLAASYYTEAGMWAKALDVLKSLHREYDKKETKSSYIKLAEIAEKCASLYQNLADKPCIPFHYFLVGLYGNEVPKSLENKLYVFRGNPLEGIMDFTKRFVLHYPGYEQINSAKIPSTDDMAKYTKAFQIIKVIAINNLNNKTSMHHTSSFNKFKFELCSVKDKSIKNELLRMNYKCFISEVKTPFPSYLPFCRISSFKCKDISPIEMAIEQIQNKSRDLKIEADKFETDDDGNISHFQMMLNGTIDAAVNGGTDKLKETFLTGKYASDHPDLADMCRFLEKEIADQNKIVGQCLKVHEKVCPEELRMLHEKMVLQHGSKSMQPMVSKDPEKVTEAGIVPDVTTPHRKVLLEEISRRGSKLKKSNKVKRITSMFFDSNSNIDRDMYQQVLINKASVAEELIPASEENCNFKELEKLYAALCNKLNLDFNLHMLPRYSTGRRETMSMKHNPRRNDPGPSKPDDVSARYSTKKQIVSERSSTTLFQNDMPKLPPKVRPSKRAQRQISQPNLTKSAHEENTCISKFVTEVLSLTDNTDDSAQLFAISSQSNIPTQRCHTLERSINIKPTTLQIGAIDDVVPQSISADPLKMDFKTLASSFTLSEDEVQPKRKISKEDFENKGSMKRNMSLNELKKQYN